MEYARTGELSERERRQMEVFDLTVRNPSPDIDAATRLQAAQELIAMRAPESIERLADALRTGEPAVVLAIIEAMERSPDPVPGLLPAAVDTLQDASPENLERLALILPRYGQPALQLIGQRALDDEAPPEKRLGPIYALSAFRRSRESAVILMAVLDDQEPSPPAEIVNAAGASLERLTGLPYGADAAQWRRWWGELKDKPIEDWLRIVVEHLSEQNTSLQQRVQVLQHELDEMADSLAGAFRDGFRVLTVDEQLAQLPEYLDNELVPVREFAVNQVERIMRDSVRLPDAVEAGLVQRLRDTDELPSIRLSAARLLNDLNHPETANLIVAVLPQVEDVAIARGYLELLVKRPTREGLTPILHWLDDATAGAAAADALWAVISREIIDQALLDGLRPAARAAFLSQGTPAHARLIAAIGAPQDLTRLENLMEAADPSLRRAVAEGLARAGAREILLRHATDVVVYPYSVRVLERGDATMVNLRALSELAPPPEHASTWAQALVALAGRLAPADLLTADDLVATLPQVTVVQRAAVLGQVIDLPPEALDVDRRNALLARLAEVQLLGGEYERAYEATQRLAGNMTPAHTKLRFRATVLAGRYEDAAALNGGPQAWVELFTSIIDTNPAVARAIGAEIRDRFSLDGQLLAGFQAAWDRLPEQEPVPGSPEASAITNAERDP